MWRDSWERGLDVARADHVFCFGNLVRAKYTYTLQDLDDERPRVG